MMLFHSAGAESETTNATENHTSRIHQQQQRIGLIVSATKTDRNFK